MKHKSLNTIKAGVLHSGIHCLEQTKMQGHGEGL